MLFQFQVRVGPQYSYYKKKAPSAAALYEPVAVDVFKYVLSQPYISLLRVKSLELMTSCVTINTSSLTHQILVTPILTYLWQVE